MDQQATYFITQTLRILSIGLLLLITSNSFAASHFPLPENHQTIYDVTKYGTVVGEITNNFQYHGQQINFTSEAIATGFAALFYKETITETSQLYWPGDDTIKSPQQTSYTLQHTKKTKKDQKISFNWPTMNHVDISSSYKNKSVTLTAEKNVWSRQLLPILMSSYLLKNDKTTGDSFLTIDKNELENYAFTFVSHDSIDFDGKKQPCLKFKITSQGSSRFTYVWLAKSFDYLPLRIEQYKDDELNVSMTLKQYKRLK